jgi:cytidylate kinase
MVDDPMVEEIHRIREKLLNECGGDLEKLMDRLKAREIEDRSRIVSDVQVPRDAVGK